MTRARLEKVAGVGLVHGWVLDGTGPARWGWARVAPCKLVWLGRTLDDAARALGVWS